MRRATFVAGMTAAAVGATLNTAAGAEPLFFCATVAGDKVTMHVAGQTVEYACASRPEAWAQGIAAALNANSVVRRTIRAYADGTALVFERR